MARDGDLTVPKKLSVEAYRRRMKIGVALRKLREQTELSITEAAARADVSYTTWKRWEKGKTAIPLELVAEICKALERDCITPIKPLLTAA